MTRTVDDVMREFGRRPVYWIGPVTSELLIAEILALRAERDALRAAVVDTEYWSGSGNWHRKHAAVIARARGAEPAAALPAKQKNEIALRRFGRDHERPCKRPDILTCALWECQVANECQDLR